ncbi:hypothetical protein GXW74_18955 [Roseomonas eburnea]|uniref:Lectin-like protein BA14k n=1 Tax=Neoroseomonas eburnea TaxID=1346889 RepID=A0A9X9XFU3_9PROT|nr:hypothetical protein [Neoroseomonas eburnea]MBR0682579.1 hypothetical protein [Neoroseomonas eburnea]
MARSRDVILLAALIAGAIAAPVKASATPLAPGVGTGPALVQYQPERFYYGPSPQYYGRPPQHGGPPPRQVCWNEYRRVHVGHDQWGRRMYRSVPRRVCGWR